MDLSYYSANGGGSTLCPRTPPLLMPVQCNCHQDGGQWLTFTVNFETLGEGGWKVSHDDYALLGS